ncbi:MAG: hypothetical protein P9X27_04390 [Candidatus Kaelpia aquatica]|nr:hypothetical protein [Candidatus Kaelpia aquatica]
MKRTKLNNIILCIIGAQEGHCQDRLRNSNKRVFNLVKKEEVKMNKALVILVLGMLFITQLASAAINQTGQIAISLRLGQVINERADQEIEGAREINGIAAGIDAGTIAVTDRTVAENEGAAFLDFVNKVNGLSDEKTNDAVEIKQCAAMALNGSELSLPAEAVDVLAGKWSDNLDSMLEELQKADQVLDDDTMTAVMNIQE